MKTPIYELKENERFCTLIGCNGTDKECPGNPHCLIIMKIRRIPSPKR